MLRGLTMVLTALWLAVPAFSGDRLSLPSETAPANLLVQTKTAKPPAQRKGESKPAFDQPMQVVIVRSSEKGCETSCPEWIMAEGMITGETPKLIAEVYERAKQRNGGKPSPVILHSSGGNIIAALQIGHFLRARSVDVAVGQTLYSGCGPFKAKCSTPAADGAYRGQLLSRGAVCLSACPLILAGGVRRLAGIDAAVGVHHWGYELPGPDGKVAAAPARRDPAWDGVVRNMISGYLTTMGISRDVVSDMDKTPFASMMFYDFKRRKQLKLVTDTANVERVISAKACKSSSAESFCR